MYKVNLLPDYLQQKSSSNFTINLALLGGLAVFLCLTLLAYGLFYYQRALDQRQLEQNTQELAGLKPQLLELQRQQTQIKLQQEKYNQLSTLVHNRLTWHSMLEDIPLALPVDTWIRRLEIKRIEKVPDNGGFASSGYRPVEKQEEKAAEEEKNEDKQYQEQPQSPPVPNIISISGSCWNMGSAGVVVENLGKLPYFEYVKLVEANHQREQGIIVFELIAKIKGGAWDEETATAP